LLIVLLLLKIHLAMTRIIFSFIALLSFVSFAFAEGNPEPPEAAVKVIKGVVYDSQTNTPLEYATVSLVRANDGSLVTGTITDSNGFFRIKGVDTGMYKLEVTFIGYNTSTVNNIEVTNSSRTVDAGTISLDAASETMEEVMVIADRPSMTYKIDKKVINVSQQHTSSSGTAVEVLENIPSITVSIEGDISLRGSGSFTVLIDGKPTILDANDVLNQLPASQIENIEIITNPSAKFDPDGVAGIINIIMKKNRLQGVSGVANINGGSHNRYGGDFLVNYRRDRLNLFLAADYNKRGMIGESIRRTETYGETDTLYLYNNGDFNRKGFSWNVRTGFDFNINPKNTISLAYRLGERERGGDSELMYEEWSSADPLNRTEYSSFEESTRGGFSQNLSVDYKYDIDKEKGHTLLMQAILASSNSEENSFNLMRNASNSIINGQKAIEKGPSKELTIKVDYTLPLGESSKFETGYQGDFNFSDESNDLFFYSTLNQEFELQDEYSVLVNYTNNVNALYAIFSSEVNDFGYQLGLRGEYTDRLVDLVDQPEEFSLNRWDLYPTLHMSYNLPAQQEVMASYTRRLQRLRGWYLEPFYTWSDAYNVRIGNPDLNPEYIDSYELSYQKKFKKNFFSFDLYYRVTHNKIERIQSIFDADDNIFLTTFANVGKDYSLGTEIMMGFDPTKWWHFDLMGNIYDYKQEGEFNGREYKTSSFNWSARFNNSFKLARFTRLQLMGMYNSPTATAQGERKGFVFANIALKQDMFKNTTSLTLQVRDVLGTMGHESTTRDIDFYSFRSWDPNTPIVSLTLTLKLNNFKVDRRGSQNGDNGMDDLGGEGDF